MCTVACCKCGKDCDILAVSGVVICEECEKERLKNEKVPENEGRS